MWAIFSEAPKLNGENVLGITFKNKVTLNTVCGVSSKPSGSMMETEILSVETDS